MRTARTTAAGKPPAHRRPPTRPEPEAETDTATATATATAVEPTPGPDDTQATDSVLLAELDGELDRLVEGIPPETPGGEALAQVLEGSAALLRGRGASPVSAEVLERVADKVRSQPDQVGRRGARHDRR